jgi:hypothetical protein
MVIPQVAGAGDGHQMRRVPENVLNNHFWAADNVSSSMSGGWAGGPTTLHHKNVTQGPSLQWFLENNQRSSTGLVSCRFRVEVRNFLTKVSPRSERASESV